MKKKKNIIFKTVSTLLLLSFVLASVCAALSSSVSELAEKTAEAITVKAPTPVSGSTITIKNNMVVNIDAGTKAYYITDSFTEACYIKDNGGKALSKNSVVSTGFKLVDIATYTEYPLVVKGDLTCDGKINGADVVRAKKYLLNKPDDLCSYEALDFNRDGKYTNDDLSLIVSAVMADPVIMPDTEITDVPLDDREPLNIGTDFYATIDIMYTDKAITPQYSGAHSVVAYKKNMSGEQTWHFTRNTDGSYTIKNFAYNMVLDLSAASVPGTDVKIFTESGSPGQKWYIVDAGDGVHSILYASDSNGIVMSAASPSVSNNTNIALAEFDDSITQKFLISKVSINASASHFDKVAKSDLGDVFYSTISAGGKRISNRYSELYLYNVKNQPGEMWKFERQADGSYLVSNMAKHGMSLDIKGAKAENLTKVQLYNSNKTAAQLWNLYIKDGKVVFSSALSKQHVLDIYSGTFNHGQAVDIYTFNNSEAQKFTLEKMTENYSPVLPKDKHYDILFIGNSFTWYHQMSIYRFYNIATAGGYDVSVKLIEHGGATLSQYVSGSYATEAANAINSGKYEYVVLQEQSTTPLTNPSGFHSAVKTLTNMVRQKGGEVVLYQTWGFHPSHGTTQSYGSVGNMEMALRNSYDAIGYDVGAIMANVGKAFTTVYNAHGLNINLWLAADLYHPSEIGSTLAAYTIFASIFRADPRIGIDHTFGSNANHVAIIKDAAYNVTFK